MYGNNSFSVLSDTDLVACSLFVIITGIRNFIWNPCLKKIISVVHDRLRHRLPALLPPQLKRG